MKKKNVDFPITKVSFPKPLFDSNTPDFEKETGEKLYFFENENHVLQTKVVELETVLAQQTNDFEDAKTDFFNKVTKFENYFERLEKENVEFERKLARKRDDSKAEKDQLLKQIASLESKLASQVHLQLQKEYNDLRI